MNPEFADEVIINALEPLGVDRHPIQGIRGDMSHSLFGAGENCFGEASVDDFLLVGKRAPRGNKSCGAGTAETTSRFDQKGFSPFPGGGRRRGTAGGAASHNDNIKGFIQRDIKSEVHILGFSGIFFATTQTARNWRGERLPARFRARGRG